MLSVSNYIPKGLVSEPLYAKIIEAMDYVIANNETDFKDILNKYKDYSDQQAQACKDTLSEYGFKNILTILDLPDTTAARLAYFINAISFFKGHKEGLILVTRLLGGFAYIKEWYDSWVGYSTKDYAILTIYVADDTVIMVSPIDNIEYLYKCTIGGTTGNALLQYPIYVGETIVDGTVTWENIGKPQKLEYWKPNKNYKLKQHVISISPTRYDQSTGSTSIDPPNTPYSIDHNTQGRQYIFECVEPDISDATEPAWDNEIGNITTEASGLEWKCLDPELYFTFSLVWSFPLSITTQHTLDYFRKFVKSYVYPVLTTWIVASAGSFQFSKYIKWGDNRDIQLGDIVYPSTCHYPTSLYKYELTTLVLTDTGAVEPVWPVIVGDTIVDGSGNTWTCRNADTQIGLGFSDYYLDWSATTVKILGDMVTSSTYNGFAYSCTDIGAVPHKTGGAEPVWPVILGDVVVDGNIEWECIAVGGRLAYIYI